MIKCLDFIVLFDFISHSLGFLNRFSYSLEIYLKYKNNNNIFY